MQRAEKQWHMAAKAMVVMYRVRVRMLVIHLDNFIRHEKIRIAYCWRLSSFVVSVKMISPAAHHRPEHHHLEHYRQLHCRRAHYHQANSH